MQQHYLANKQTIIASILTPLSIHLDNKNSGSFNSLNQKFKHRNNIKSINFDGKTTRHYLPNKYTIVALNYPL